MDESIPRTDALLLLECSQVLHEFFQCLDDRRYDEMMAFFSPGGRWYRQGHWLEDAAAIRLALDSRPASQATCHVMSNAHVSARTDDAVTVEAYMTAYRHDAATAGVLPMLRGPFRINQVTTVFRRDGARLRIAEQRMVPRFGFEMS